MVMPRFISSCKTALQKDNFDPTSWFLFFLLIGTPNSSTESTSDLLHLYMPVDKACAKYYPYFEVE